MHGNSRAQGALIRQKSRTVDPCLIVSARMPDAQMHVESWGFLLVIGKVFGKHRRGFSQYHVFRPQKAFQYAGGPVRDIFVIMTGRI